MCLGAETFRRLKINPINMPYGSRTISTESLISEHRPHRQSVGPQAFST